VTTHSLTRRLILGGLLIGLAALIAGCGSSKPAYCKNVSALQKSVTGINVTGGVSALKTQVQTIQSQAKSVVSSAKSDFPSQTQAIDSAISTLETDVKALSSSPSPAQLAAVAVGVKNTVTSVSGFASATKSKCQ
jgi:hypothetical protein